jgi:type IV secretion system protein VirB4
VRDSFLSTLAAYRPRILAVRNAPAGEFSEVASFIALLLGGDHRPIATSPGDLGQLIPDRRLTFGHDSMDLGPGGGSQRHFAAMLSLKDYPAWSSSGLFDGVSRLPCELLLSESFSFLDRQASQSRMGLALRRLRAADDEAFSLRDELTLARDEVGAGRNAYGEHHLTVLVRSPSLAALNPLVARVQSAMTEAGGVAVREDLNLEPAFWAQFPGNFRFIARRAMVSAANFAGFASLHNHAMGQPSGNHWGPALTVLETTALGPYHFNFHVGDLGNFTVIGPSGSGKTVLLTFLLAQSRKYSPRVLYFDKDRGAEPFIRASRGSYHVLRPGEPSGFNPLLLPIARPTGCSCSTGSPRS